MSNGGGGLTSIYGIVNNEYDITHLVAISKIKSQFDSVSTGKYMLLKSPHKQPTAYRYKTTHDVTFKGEIKKYIDPFMKYNL